MKLKAYAKINWYLYVKGKRPDGYHDLEMVMQHIDLYDDIFIEPLPQKDFHLFVEGGMSLENTDDNLIIKAAKLLQEESRINAGARIHLKKRIPIGAGLGGGSADAAAVLIGLNHVWNLGYTLNELQHIGIRIGADVPYCLEPGPAIVSGIGENIRKVDFKDEAHILLLKPKASLSTKEVFMRYCAQEQATPMLNEALTAIANGKYKQLNILGLNGLQVTAISMLPEIGQLVDLLKTNGALFAQMSGSGSAVFGVFNTKEEAISAHQGLQDFYHICILSKTLRSAIAIDSKL